MHTQCVSVHVWPRAPVYLRLLLYYCARVYIIRIINADTYYLRGPESTNRTIPVINYDGNTMMITTTLHVRV